MPDYFAVMDVGSNALRSQVVSVEQPGCYRVLDQSRQPIRLGHQVFETGELSSLAIEPALEALRNFKAAADRYQVKALRAVATSALREASNAASFIAQAKRLDVPLEVLSEEEEARLISVGIMSGLRFDPPLGLFMDIGGGSVEVAVANRTNVFCLFSLPLGAVRLTEKFIKNDPALESELKALRRFADQRLKPMARRIKKEKFTMAFGSAGTITALAETDARLSGEAGLGTLTVLRRNRLKALLDLLKTEAADRRATLIAGDPKRTDIIVAGGLVLLGLMDHIGLDYLFVSARGLRDGLMIDLLRNRYPDHETAWVQEGGRPESLEQLGEKYHYDAPHAFHVSQLAVSLFYQLTDLHKLPEKYAGTLHAAAMLHDVGLFIAYPKHHKHSYYLIKSSGPASLNKSEVDLVANIARYHRKAFPSPKHLPFGQLPPDEKEAVRKLSALLRIADGLDCRHEARVQSVACAVPRAKSVVIRVRGHSDLKSEIEGATAKAKLLNEVFNVKTLIQEDDRPIKNVAK